MTMTTTTHTPGPWTVDGNEIFGPQDSGVIVARLPEWGILADGPDPAAHNARLIAAAPDLLEALQYALERFECIPEHRDEIGLYRTGARLARAAIAKATGA